MNVKQLKSAAQTCPIFVKRVSSPQNMSDKSLNIRDPHAWPVAASILLLFTVVFNAVAGLVISALGVSAALIYYYGAKRKQGKKK